MTHLLHFEKARKQTNDALGRSRWCWMTKDYIIYLVHTKNDENQRCSLLTDVDNNVLHTMDGWPQAEEVWDEITQVLEPQNITCMPLPFQVVATLNHQLIKNSTSSGATPL